MKNVVYQIFREAFPAFPMPADKLFSCINYEACSILTVEEAGEIVGFSAVCDNSIRLLCVREGWQRKGYGSKLLSMSEERIAAAGFKEAVLGGTSSGLCIGAPVTEAELLGKYHPFFGKYGYKAEEGCHEMRLSLQDFQLEKAAVTTNAAVTLGYYTDEDRQPLFEAVADVDEDWVQYFQDTEYVFCAFLEGKVVSFAILDFDDTNILCREGAAIGSIGCVGTVRSVRKKGIGLKMVALATEELKKRGCAESFIHYTHVDKWYAKLGYRNFLHYWFGKKDL